MSLWQATVRGLRANDVGIVSNPPLTDTASSHSITIRTSRGIKIGRIQSWSPAMTRVIDTVFEVNQRAIGEPIERIAQIQNGNRISVERFELYNSSMGEAFGTSVMAGNNNIGDAQNDLVSLVLQTKPFNVREMWYVPTNEVRAYEYIGCLFSDLGYTISAVDDRTIRARATLEFSRRIRLQ